MLVKGPTTLPQSTELFANELEMAACKYLLNYAQQQVAHVKGLPGSPRQDEIRYSLGELALEVETADRIAADFFTLPGRSF